MASNKRKQDEKHLKMLREMVALPSNKTCFDCHQRGPTYVNMTIGSFVCTSCSGILRGLNPPHRVKSISMASFTPDEMDFLKAHLNELNRKVYLGLYDNRTWPEPDSRDEQRVRDFMVQKYENKRFYVAPTEAMRDEARRMNEAALSKQPQTKPLRALLGENATKLVIGNSQTSHATQNHTVAASTMAAPVKSTVPPPVTAQSQQQPVKPATGGFDLLGDLGSDPFASSAPATATSNTVESGFADFSSFGSTSASTPAQPAQPAQPTAPAAFPPMSSAPLQPFSGGGLQPQQLNAGGGNAPPPTSTPTQGNTTNFASISDKYAALADLDTTFNAPTQSTTVNWGGSEATVGTGISTNVGTTVNWGGSGSAGTGSGDGGAMSWGGQPAASGSGGGGWNSGVGTGVPPTSSMGGGGVFGGQTSSAANPFGGSSTQAMPQGGQANPFGATSTAGFGQAPSAGFGQAPSAGFGQNASAGFGQNPGAGFGQTPGAGFGQTPASSAAGFGYQQYPVQNGGFGMATTTGGYGGFGGMPPATAPPSYGVAQQQGFQAQPGFPQAQGFPAQQGFGGGWGQMGGGVPQQPAAPANPFMSAVNQQQVPPRGTSTNPFL